MRRALLVVLSIVAALIPTGADAKWTQVRSANFVFVGDASEGQIRRIAEKLEQFREVMLRALPGATAASPVPTVVMVFATDRSLRPAAPLFNGNPIELAGYFQQGEDLNYIAIDAEYIEPALLAIFHEYSHFLVTNSIGPLPAWASEGLAEVYELVQERDGGKKAMVGLAPQQHVELLKASTLIPIRDLLAVNQESSVYNEGTRRGVFYAQSWALVHYLSFGNPERSKQFRQFLASVRSGSPAPAAFDEAFGDAAVLDRELFMYVRNYLFPAILFDFGEKVGAGTVQKGQPLDDMEAAIYLADLQGRVGRLEESRTRLAAIVKQNPNAARAHAALGLQEFRANQIDKALPLLERASSIGTNDGWVQNAYGRALIAQFGGGVSSDNAQATVQRARTVLTRAVELDPNSAFAAAMLGYVELILDTDAAHAATLLERATRLAPSREQVPAVPCAGVDPAAGVHEGHRPARAAPRQRARPADPVPGARTARQGRRDAEPPGGAAGRSRTGRANRGPARRARDPQPNRQRRRSAAGGCCRCHGGRRVRPPRPAAGSRRRDARARPVRGC